jgi:transcriptional regulator
MYIPAPFAETDRKTLIDFIAKHPFATLITARAGAVGISHIPMYFASEGGRDFLVGHLARANDHWKTLAGPGTAVFHGPHAYVSSSWYEARNTVPTWNYAVVHAHGLLSLTGPEELEGIIARMLAIHESAAAPDMDGSVLASLMAHIVGIKMDVTSLEGKWKLSQNKSAEVREKVAGRLESQKPQKDALSLAEANARALAEMMRESLRARPLKEGP